MPRASGSSRSSASTARREVTATGVRAGLALQACPPARPGRRSTPRRPRRRPAPRRSPRSREHPRPRPRKGTEATGRCDARADDLGVDDRRPERERHDAALPDTVGERVAGDHGKRAAVGRLPRPHPERPLSGQQVAESKRVARRRRRRVTDSRRRDPVGGSRRAPASARPVVETLGCPNATLPTLKTSGAAALGGSMGGREGLCRRHLEGQADDAFRRRRDRRKRVPQDGSSAPRFAEVERQIGAALRADARGDDERIAAHGDGKASVCASGGNCGPVGRTGCSGARRRAELLRPVGLGEVARAIGAAPARRSERRARRRSREVERRRLGRPSGSPAPPFRERTPRRSAPGPAPGRRPPSGPCSRAVRQRPLPPAHPRAASSGTWPRTPRARR